MIKWRGNPFDKLFDMGYNWYTLSTKNKYLTTKTLKKLRAGDTNVNMITINRLCQVLNCQPGDLLEYVPDDIDNESETE